MLDISEEDLYGPSRNLELNDSEECRAASAKISAHYLREISYLGSQ